MHREQVAHVVTLLTCVCALTIPARAQDEIRVAAASPCLVVASNPIEVPVYVRDVSGTPLGADQPPGKKIEGLSFQIAYSPAEAVSSIQIRRTGVLAGRVAVSEFALRNANTVSYIGLFEEQFNTIPFRLDAPPPGDLIAVLVITLGTAAPGSRIDFTFGNAATTALTDQNGIVSETENNGTLRPENGCVQLAGPRRRAVRK